MPVVIPELVYIIGLLFAVLGYMAARGLLATWTHSIGYMLEWLAARLSFKIRLRGLPDPRIDLGGPFRAVDRAVVSALQNWCDGAEIEMGYCLHGLEKVGRYMAQAIDFGFRETAQTFDWLVHIHLPKWARYALLPLLLPLLIPKLIAAILPHIKAGTIRTVRVVTHDVQRTVVHTITRAVGGAVAFPPWVIRLPRRVKDVERAERSLAKRLHKVEGFAAAAVFAGLLANVLGVTTRCVRSGNVGKTARRLCGLSARGLEDLLGLLADLFLLTNVCQAITLVSDGLAFIEPEITAFITAAETMACYGDDEHLPPGPDVFLSLPPVTGLVLPLAA